MNGKSSYGIYKIGLLVLTSVFIWMMYEFAEFRKNNPAIFVLTGGDLSHSTAIVSFKIGEQELHIPRNYFFILPAQATYYGHDLKLHKGADKEQVNFALSVMFPSLEPGEQTHGLGLESGDAGEHGTIDVLNDSPAATGSAAFDLFYQRRSFDASNANDDGYRQFPLSGDSIGVFQGTVAKPKHFALCTEIDHAVAPSCNRCIRVTPRMVVEYTFPFKNIPNIAELDQRITDLLNGFRISGPPFTLSE